ncbi:hypothetical protein AB0I81_37970 [Nonomuraea sp. NPDC050404]|uniref:hypothetical protein n=1 Tax=Nonomuraea sp. NPDC050404 TaxID=3155783 RepID=UPI0033D3F59A
MATENSGPHLPSSWPDAPRRDPSPAWADATSAEVPTSWPETPKPARDEPAWPEPPRTDPSWPEPPGAARPDAAGGPASWPDSASHPSWPDSASHPSWPDPAPQGSVRPDVPRPHDSRQDVPMPWSDSSPSVVPTSWPDSSPGDVPISWPDAPPPQSPAGTSGWPEVSSKGAPPPSSPPQHSSPSLPPLPSAQHSSPSLPSPQAPVPDPVPAWEQPPAPAPGAWSNLADAAPWPPAEAPAERTTAYNNPNPPAERPAVYNDPNPPAERPAVYNDPNPPAERTMVYNDPNPPADAPPRDVPPHRDAPPAQSHPADERTVTYAQHKESLLNDRAVPSSPMNSPHPDAPPNAGQPPRPGGKLSRDPSDPENRFVTAGQISGSRTPPPERQQELWNTVFGDNYQAMGERDPLDEEEGSGKPVWIYALGGSVGIALVAAVLWAFLWGPLAGEAPSSANVAGEKPTSAPPTPPKKTSTSIGALPRYPGKASPVIGRVPDAAAGISMPRLGGNWQLDQRATVKGTYGFDTRQYIQVAPDRYAQVMSAPLSQRLSSYYEADDLEPAIKQVVLSARRSFFPPDNKVRKIAQQPIKVGDQTGRLIAYSLTSKTEKATIVTMAVNTGAEVPAIVYMSIPAESKKLLPDIRVVMNQLKLSAQ